MKKLLILGFLALAGCGGALSTETPADKFYAARASYDGTFLAGAANYNELPRCTVDVLPSVAKPCSTQAIVVQLRSYDKAAKAALDAAQDVILNHPTVDASALVLDAQDAVAAAVIICNELCHGTAVQ